MNNSNSTDLPILIASAPIGICILDAKTLVSEIVNDSFLEVAGKPREDIIGKYYWDSFAEAAPYYEAALSGVVATGEPYYANEVELMLVRHGKEENIFVTFVYVALKNASGEVYKVAVWVLENTLQVKSRQLLEEAKLKVEAAEETLRNMIMQAPVAMAILLGPQHTIAVANSLMLELWGKPTSSVMNKPVFEALPDAKGQGLEDIMQRVYATGQTYRANEMPVALIRHGDADIVYQNFVYEPYRDSAGNTVGVIAITIDVTDPVLARQRVEKLNDHLSESEERFKLMAEGSAILIAVGDETSNATYFSKAWVDLTGKSMKSLLKFGWVDLIHPDDRDGYVKIYLDAFKHRSSFTGEFRVLSRTGEYRWLLANGSPRIRPDNSFAGYISSCVDITEQKMVEQRKDDFISIASHELKTPITSLKASIQLMERFRHDSDPAMLDKLITQSNRSMDKISRLINDLLSVSRLTEGQLGLNKTYFRLVDLLNNSCGHVRAQGKYEIRCEGDGGLRVYADEHRIEQVVVNFVNNAVKYAPQSPVIYLRAEKVGQWVKISVQDTGPGLSVEQQARLFARYYRVDHNLTPNSGIGLGLYISAEIVRRHGGEIGVDSEPGKGSTFWFTLPL